MLTANRTMPLDALYEPPEDPTEVSSKVLPQPQPVETSVKATPSQEQSPRNMDVPFVVSKLGQWTSQDAIVALGEPLREWDSTIDKERTKKFEYSDPTDAERHVRLTFESGSDVLIGVSVLVARRDPQVNADH
jgi:hypothetical protein